jgi:sugar lactone lactonase YvrE
MKILLVLTLVVISSCAHKKTNSDSGKQKLKIAFETMEGIMHPESVLYSHEHKTIFVTNIASGNPMEKEKKGHLSKLASNGKVLAAKWITGFKAPKGMAIFGDFLYIADVDRLVVVKISGNKIHHTFPVKGAQFLNDVTVDQNGIVYFSDMFDPKIYKLEKNKITTFASGTNFPNPNGLKMINNAHLLVGFWGWGVDQKTFGTKTPGALLAIDLKKPEANVESLSQSECRGNLDGVDTDNKGNVWVSDWVSGDVWKVQKNGKSSKMFNFGQGTADISIAKELGLLLIPQMNKNKIIAVKI